MKETTRDSEPRETPLGQFLSNGQENAYITKQEEQVSAKLDKLNDIAIPRSVSQDSLDVKRDEDSIVHLLNSKDYALPMPENSTEGPEEDYYYPGMSPPVTLPIPKDIPTEAPQLTSPVADEPLPYSRPVEEPEETSQSESQQAESPMKLERKAINLQTYLKRKKDDDPVEPMKEEIPAQEEENLPPTPVKTPKDTEVELDNDLIEWASQDTAETDTQDKAASPDLNKTPELNKTLDTESGAETTTPLKTPEKMETSFEDRDQGDSQEEIEAKVAAIRSPSGSPVDSLLEEKLASPTATVPATAGENKEEGELEAESEEEKPKVPREKSVPSEKGSRSRSHSQNRKLKKDKKKKSKKKKKKERIHDSDLEEDIRKLELLKAELEREERREKKEKEKRRQRKRSASPRGGSKDKRKKEKRQRR